MLIHAHQDRFGIVPIFCTTGGHGIPIAPRPYRACWFGDLGPCFAVPGLWLRRRDLVRVIDSGGVLRTVLTYKDPTADEGSQSKPEHETVVASGGVIDVILSGLDLVHQAEVEKRIASYRFTSGGRHMLATMVTAPEIDETFVQLETPAREEGLEPALGALRDALAVLGIGEGDPTTDTYTAAVLRARA